MLFFDNWRVQAATVGVLDDNMSQKIDAVEKEYAVSSPHRKTEIFNEYCKFSSKIQEHICDSLAKRQYVRCLRMESGLWKRTVQLYPYLSEITDTDTKKAILCCKTEEEQDSVLARYLGVC